MSLPPSISVVICTYNRAAYLPEALGSLTEQSLATSKFEVIVVNNNSTDHTESVCHKFIAEHPTFPFTYLLETRQGASFARNTGAACAKGIYLCFLDDDAVTYPDYLENILTFFMDHPEAGGLGGRIIPRYIPTEPRWMSHFVSSLVGNFNYSDVIVEFSPNRYPLESNMVIRKSDFDEIGGFNTALPGVKGTLRIGGEGKDFFFRLKEKGHRIFYDPSVIVEHVVEVNKLTSEYMYRVASGIGRGEQVRTLSKGWVHYIWKILEYLYKLGGSIILGIWYALKGTPAKSWPVIQFRIDALKGLMDTKI
jgi:glucosyl-dolichyl phosphate glucuronosyltransferase